MCGIVGGFGLITNSFEIEESLTSLIHRGPDSQGFKEFPGKCFMGVARLAMTDPHPRSDQPLVSGNSDHAISFNGEIYNFRDLRKSLIEEGVVFDTESDTEVLLHMMRTKGVQALSQLEGMFAFAYYSTKDEQLIIARDKLGKKPLYFSIQDQNIYWSSSLELLAKLMRINYESNEAIFDYMSLGYQLDPNTGYPGIYALLPGHYLEFNRESGNQAPITFPKSSTKKSSPTNLREELWKAIQVRIDGHERVALSLSGGVDSTLIALGLRELGVSTNTFSAFWSDSDKSRYNSDAEHAEKIANTLGHEFTPVDISINFNLRDNLKSFLNAMEEPNNNPSGLSSMELYGAVANKGIRLLLTGDGSDEIFGGYARHGLVAKVPRLLNVNNSLLDSLLFSRSSGSKRAISNVIASQIKISHPKLWLHWHFVFTPREIAELFNVRSKTNEISSLLNFEVDRLSSEPLASNATQSIMNRDHKIWLTMESNRKLDRISMKYSIEARSPFQDENVIKFAENAMSRTHFKVLNKEILRDEFPELKNLPIKHEKVGFTSPVGHWMREDPEFIISSINYLLEMPQFNQKYLTKFKNMQFKGDFRTNMQLWTLVVYANWLMVKNGD
jgi:asparagine synthase (glutamine-hydrolysing)